MDDIIPTDKRPVEPPTGTDRPAQSWTWPAVTDDERDEPWVSEFPHDARTGS